MPLNLKAPMPHTSIGTLLAGKGFPSLAFGVHTDLTLADSASEVAEQFDVVTV